jgi:hypothetical protein
MLFLFVRKHATLVTRSNVTSLSLQLVFSGDSIECFGA